MERSVSEVGYCISKATKTSAKVADLVTICLTCFSRYLVLQHCRSRSHLTRVIRASNLAQIAVQAAAIVQMRA